MQTQAYFENIQQEIFRELEKEEQSIHIAVAWFTDGGLWEQLNNPNFESIEFDAFKNESGQTVLLILKNI